MLCREARSEGGLRLAGDGDTFLSAIYIDNLVDVVLSALEAPDASARSYYLADPEVLHARELLRLWSEAVELPAPRSGPPIWLSWPLASVRGRAPGGISPDELLQRGRSTLFDVNAAIGSSRSSRRSPSTKACARWPNG